MREIRKVLAPILIAATLFIGLGGINDPKPPMSTSAPENGISIQGIKNDPKPPM